MHTTAKREGGGERNDVAAHCVARSYVTRLSRGHSALATRDTTRRRAYEYAHGVALDVIAALVTGASARRATPNLPARMAMLRAEGIDRAHAIAALADLGEALRTKISQCFPEVAYADLARVVDERLISELVRAVSISSSSTSPELRLNADAARQHALTRREAEVLLALRTDAALKDLANAMEISLNTFKHHVTSLGRKLRASGRDHVLERASVLGILVPLTAAAAVVGEFVDLVT